MNHKINKQKKNRKKPNGKYDSFFQKKKDKLMFAIKT